MFGLNFSKQVVQIFISTVNSSRHGHKLLLRSCVNTVLASVNHGQSICQDISHSKTIFGDKAFSLQTKYWNQRQRYLVC